MDAVSDIEQTIVSVDASPLIPDRYLASAPFRFDFSRSNPDIKHVDMMSADSLDAYVRETLRKAGCTWGMGGYGEDRFFYQSSNLFKKRNEYRTIHLGLDIWLPPGTGLRVPISGIVKSVQDNNHFLDYGPTIILEHRLGPTHFYTLYGHLSRASTQNRFQGESLNAGDSLAAIGDANENGSWAPHLHLQIIKEMLGHVGDFPGTAAPSEKEMYLRNSPNPEILLSRFLPAA